MSSCPQSNDPVRIRRALEKAYALPEPHGIGEVLRLFTWEKHPGMACEGLAEIVFRLAESEPAAVVPVAVNVRVWCNQGKGIGKRWGRCRYCPIYMNSEGVALRSSWAWRLLEGVSRRSRAV